MFPDRCRQTARVGRRERHSYCLENACGPRGGALGGEDRNARDLLTIEVLRSILEGRRAGDYNDFVRACLRYVRAFLAARHFQRRFGFAGAFSEEIGEVADDVVGNLLREEEQSDGSVRWPALHTGLTAMAEVGDPGSSGFDDHLLASFRSLLRRAAEHGLVLAWAKQHRFEARLLRALKRNLKRDPEARLVRDSRGQWIAGPESDFRRPPIPSSLLEEILAPVPPRARSILDALRPHLVSGPEHGGTCYLMEVVRQVAGRSAKDLERCPQDSGAAPAENQPLADSQGLPWSMFREHVERSLVEIACEVLRADEETRRRRAANPCPTARRGREPEPTAAVADAWIQVSVEMVLRPFGMGRMDGSSQSGLLSRILGAEYLRDPAWHRKQTDYLIRRIRERWLPRTL